tara:strand:+ start:3714 stop:4715 length:1002 start_codon:yes stop_codon:yes gene_type:complete
LKKSKELKVGIIVIAALAAFYFGFNFLKGADIFSEKRQFYVVYPRVDGLSVDNSVQYNGIKVGRVNSVDLIGGGSDGILVGFEVTNDELHVADNSVANIVSMDLFNSKAIVIERGDSEIEAKSGDTLVSAIEADLKTDITKRLQPIQQKAENLMLSIDSTIAVYKKIGENLSHHDLDKTLNNLDATLLSLSSAANSIDDLARNNSYKLEAVLDNVGSITENLRKNNDQLTEIFRNFSQISDSIAAADLVRTINNAGDAMVQVASVMEKIDKGEGTIGQLVNNDTLYYNLEEASLELDKLVEDIRLNPKRYIHFSVFGRKEKAADKPKKKERTE